MLMYITVIYIRHSISRTSASMGICRPADMTDISSQMNRCSACIYIDFNFPQILGANAITKEYLFLDYFPSHLSLALSRSWSTFVADNSYSLIPLPHIYSCCTVFSYQMIFKPVNWSKACTLGFLGVSRSFASRPRRKTTFSIGVTVLWRSRMSGVTAL